MFAGDNIGTAASPLITAVGNIQAAATTGSIWLVNDGALTLGGVLASTPPSGVQAGGTVTITAMSPITVAQSINAVGEITLTSTHDADRGDMIVQGGALIDSSAGSVFLQAGDSFTQDAGSTIQAAISVSITGDYENQSGTGPQMTLNGVITAPSVVIDGVVVSSPPPPPPPPPPSRLLPHRLLHLHLLHLHHRRWYDHDRCS